MAFSLSSIGGAEISKPADGDGFLEKLRHKYIKQGLRRDARMIPEGFSNGWCIDRQQAGAAKPKRLQSELQGHCARGGLGRQVTVK